jgi:hypothetical protein
MRERDDQPGGAVRLNVIGRSWNDDSSGSPRIRGILPQNQRDPWTLRASRSTGSPGLISARLKEQGLNAGPEPARRASVDPTEASEKDFCGSMRFCTLVTLDP